MVLEVDADDGCCYGGGGGGCASDGGGGFCKSCVLHLLGSRVHCQMDALIPREHFSAA